MPRLCDNRKGHVLEPECPRDWMFATMSVTVTYSPDNIRTYWLCDTCAARLAERCDEMGLSYFEHELESD